MAREGVSGIRPQGTRYYTAPEALLNGAGGQFADLYPIGATWYFLLTGLAPAEDVVELFESRPNTVEVARQLRDGELAPTPLELLLPYIPVEVTQLVHRLLSPVPKDRVRDASRHSGSVRARGGDHRAGRQAHGYRWVSTPSSTRPSAGLPGRGPSRQARIAAWLPPSRTSQPPRDTGDRPGNVVSFPGRRRHDPVEEGGGGTTQAEPELP